MPGAGTSFSVDGGGVSGFSEIQAGSITGTSVNQSLIQVAQVVLTAAQVQSIFGAAIVLIPAPGAGKTILVDYILQRLTVGSAAFAGGGVVTIGYTGGAAVVNTVAAAVINNATSADTVVVTGASNITALQNTGVQIANATGAFTGGTGAVNSSLTYFIYYSVV
jgi:hypothetical protein